MFPCATPFPTWIAHSLVGGSIQAPWMQLIAAEAMCAKWSPESGITANAKWTGRACILHQITDASQDHTGAARRGLVRDGRQAGVSARGLIGCVPCPADAGETVRRHGAHADTQGPRHEAYASTVLGSALSSGKAFLSFLSFLSLGIQAACIRHPRLVGDLGSENDHARYMGLPCCATTTFHPSTPPYSTVYRKASMLPPNTSRFQLPPDRNNMSASFRGDSTATLLPRRRMEEQDSPSLLGSRS